VNNIVQFIQQKIFFPILLGFERLIGSFSPVGNPPVFNNEAFPWTRKLEENWEDIRAELDVLLQFHSRLPNLQDIQEEQQYITTDDKWKTFFLLGFGNECSLNMEKCPKTTALIREIPGIQTALFSILSPGKHITRHRGVYKGLIRSHLGLLIPGEWGDCRMQVDDQWVKWREGEMAVFDNTSYHEVWNDTDHIRVILMIDVVRPFPAPLSWINEGIIKLIARSPYVTNALKKHKKWEQEFDALYQQEHA
jgi:aspartyl/asparaginyl beta-hydroxylase (cupin superfamily)